MLGGRSSGKRRRNDLGESSGLMIRGQSFWGRTDLGEGQKKTGLLPCCGVGGSVLVINKRGVDKGLEMSIMKT